MIANDVKEEWKMAIVSQKPKSIEWLVAILSLLASLPASSFAQETATPAPPQAQVVDTAKPAPVPSTEAKTETASPANEEELRQAQIQEDTKKLFQLSAELRAEVGKTYKDSLSLTVLKKAEDLEKLARSLKALMDREAAAAKK